jgi:hypothetical protein
MTDEKVEKVGLRQFSFQSLMVSLIMFLVSMRRESVKL